ncbi:MAG: hypothetical protein IKA05_06845 [Clostridia bacterium]|nr:hypothetical protein [Clostridia bacterium]
MSELLALLFESFTTVVTGLAGGIKTAATNLIYEDGSSGALSTVIQFIFIVAGLSIAMTVFFMVFRLIRFGRQR